jgi:hypothetical protein
MEEFGSVRGGEEGESGGARGGRKEFGLGEVEGDTVGFAEFLKAFDVECNVAKGKDSGGVIEEGHGGCEGALVVITWVSEEALVGTGMEFCLERAKDFI